MKDKITLDNLTDGPAHSMKIEKVKTKYLIRVELVNPCCETFNYCFGSTFDIYQGELGLFEKVDDDWSHVMKINYCPFCGKKICLCDM